MEIQRAPELPTAAKIEAETVFYLRCILHDHTDPRVRVDAGRVLLEYVDREKRREREHGEAAVFAPYAAD